MVEVVKDLKVLKMKQEACIVMRDVYLVYERG
jgi:hypothetical protein